MISVIIIGRNEAANIQDCLDAVRVSLREAGVSKYETVFVDSDSEDDSLERAINARFDSVWQLSGKGVNAAVARNTGALHSSGDKLLFVDADMILKPEALKKMIARLTLHALVTGWFVNRKDPEAKETVFHPYSNSSYLNTMGGYFLIDRQTWMRAGGMKEHYRKKQDADFFLRLRKKGISMYTLTEVLAVHRAKDYMDRTRMWKMLFREGHFKYRGMLYRDHFFNAALCPLIMRNDYTLLLMIPVVFAAVFLSPWLVAVYVFPLLLRSALHKPRSVSSFFERIPFYIIRDMVTGASLLFFHPGRKRKVSLKKVL